MTHLSRRAIVLAIGATAAGLLAACTPAAPAAPTAAPGKPAAPAATTAPATPAAAASPVATKPAASPVAAASPGAQPATAASPIPVAAATGGMDRVQPLAQRARVRLLLNPQGAQPLPLLRALELNYFQRAGLDVEAIIDRGSSVTQMAMVARGDIDMVPTSPSPPLFNQLTQGFDLKVVASVIQPREGRLSDIWLAVAKEKENEIRELRDLSGKTVEAGAQGTPTDLIAREAVRQAGLTDVNITYRVRTPPDFIALAQNKGADVFAIFEPFATQLQQQGLLVKWKTYGVGDLAPWYRPFLLVASQQFGTNNRAALEKFLEVHLVSSREINTTNGQWNDELTGLVARGANLPPQIITAQGGIPHFEPNGTVSVESLDRTQEAWIATGAMQAKVDSTRLLDLAPLQAALSRIGTVS